MRLLLVGRVTAAVLSLTTFVFLFLHDSWRADNLFLVPDLILCAVLLAGALLPARSALVVLPVGLAYTTGVLTASAFSYVARGEVGVPSMVGAITSAVVAMLLARRSEPGAPRPQTA
ncbi:hypothetical protein [Actinoplanes xinjiangensis]|uniref:hypothetical protein n=1 Tax=Actinoplanes xinjiangensis TaxID=512350 RepID=UPI00341EBC15